VLKKSVLEFSCATSFTKLINFKLERVYEVWHFGEHMYKFFRANVACAREVHFLQYLKE